MNSPAAGTPFLSLREIRRSFGGVVALGGVLVGAVIGWAVANSVFFLGGSNGKHGFDPYPYILLNLFLSMLAGVQAAALLIADRSARIGAAVGILTIVTSEALLLRAGVPGQAAHGNRFQAPGGNLRRTVTSGIRGLLPRGLHPAGTQGYGRSGASGAGSGMFDSGKDRRADGSGRDGFDPSYASREIVAICPNAV